MSGFAIGAKIKELRIRNGLTQEELANRSELSKGFISQIESEQTSPSIATLVDILECLGTNLRDFFNEATEEKIVFAKKDYFETENLDEGSKITWLVPNCQKNDMEPIILQLGPGGKSTEEEPHNGEEFGIVFQGTVMLHIGDKVYKVRKGESFYFLPFSKHYISNDSTKDAKVLWVVTPPSF